MSISAEQRRLAAIMFTDMVGYTALAQRNEALALELLEEHRRILRSIFPRFNGAEIKTIGDAFLVEFQSALEAAQCALEIQRTLGKRNHDVSSERRIEVRIGIHIGDVMHREGDVYGDGVNIASRIQPVAGIGGICISVDVERQIHNALEVTFEKLAPIELKNVQVPMDLFRIVLPWEKDTRLKPERRGSELHQRRAIPLAWIGTAVVLLTVVAGLFLLVRHMVQSKQSGIAELPAKSIAVLPFENLSRDPDNAYFTEGVQDEILMRLAKIADLKVVSRTSTVRYKSSPDDLREIATRLGVANVLEGSVQRTADRVHVNVQLIKAASDAHLWAEAYDRKLTDVFAVESEIAKTIAETLQAKLTGSEERAMAAKPTADFDAHQLYLKGRYLWNRRTGENLKKALAYFEQAAERDPHYALAYTGIADSCILIPAYSAGSPQEYLPRARAAAQKAVELDDTLAEAHTSLAYTFFLDFKRDQSVKEFERAISLNPNYAPARQWYGRLLLPMVAEFDRAIAEEKRALELDPVSPIISTDLGTVYALARRYDEAIAQLRDTVEMNPQFYRGHWELGSALELKGAASEAIAEYHKAFELSDNPVVLALLAHAEVSIGKQNEARQILDRLTQEAKARYVPAYAFAVVHLALGERDQALDWLEKAAHDHAGTNINLIKVDPYLDPLRGDPRFEALVQKVVGARHK